MKEVPYVFSPAANGIFASGSKPKDSYPWATTNHTYCACIAEKLQDTKIPPEVDAVFEVVINGLNMDCVKEAMNRGIHASSETKGLRIITSANYGGTLGNHKINLADVL